MNKPSRGLRADGEMTRARILEAAGELFAAKGYAEATNKAIATTAQVDLASINYHFGNRGGLYRSVLAEAHHRLVNVTDLRQLSDSDLPAMAKLRVLIEQLVVYSTEEPRSWHLRVLAREVLAPTSHLHVVFQDVALPKVLLVKRMLSEITDIPENDPALTRCLLSIGAPCMMLLVGGRAFPGSWQDVFLMPTQVIVDHLHRFALGGLEVIRNAYRRQADA
jgi:AcrR family transcriptional regulator